jgi:hypothetical protein
MNNDKVVTWASEEHRKKDLRRQKINDFKFNAFMVWHKVYWKFLHLSGLARPYSVLMCKLNLYRKLPDGQCMWCGVNHK